MTPLSPTDAMFLWLEGRRQPMHVAGLQLYTPPPGAPPDHVQRLVEAWRQHGLSPDPHERRPPLWAQEKPRRPELVDADRPPEPGLLERALRAGAEIVPGVQSGLRELVREASAGGADAQPFHAPPTMFNV